MKLRYVCILLFLAMLSASCQKAPEGLILRLSDKTVEAADPRDPADVLNTSEEETHMIIETEEGRREPEKTSFEENSGNMETERQHSEQMPGEPAVESRHPSVELETEGQIPSGELEPSVPENSTAAADGSNGSSAYPSTQECVTDSSSETALTEVPAEKPTETETAEQTEESSTEQTEGSSESTTEAAVQDPLHTETNAQRIEIVSLPDKTHYGIKDERIQTEGLRVRAFWEDGAERVLDNDEYSLKNDSLRHGGDNEFFASKLGSHTIFAVYGSTSASFVITVEESEDAPLTMCRLKFGRTVFYTGEYTQKLFAELRTDFRSISPLEEGASFSPERLTEAGTTTVHISYGQHTADIALTVVPHTAFVPDRDDLYDGDRASFILSRTLYVGQVLTAEILVQAVNERRVVITDIVPWEEFVFEPAVITEKGKQEFTVTCRGVTWTFPVNVRR
ncbi:MAG: hypothetical protein IJM50_00150 [Lachnospiraceae bacterium]|nr:hypothetical protein [Lachnospiraceae bacterium]